MPSLIACVAKRGSASSRRHRARRARRRRGDWGRSASPRYRRLCRPSSRFVERHAVGAEHVIGDEVGPSDPAGRAARPAADISALEIPSVLRPVFGGHREARADRIAASPSASAAAAASCKGRARAGHAEHATGIADRDIGFAAHHHVDRIRPVAGIELVRHCCRLAGALGSSPACRAIRWRPPARRRFRASAATA